MTIIFLKEMHLELHPPDGSESTMLRFYPGKVSKCVEIIDRQDGNVTIQFATKDKAFNVPEDSFKVK